MYLKNELNFIFNTKLQRTDFAYGNYKPRGYTYKKQKKKYFARICTCL